MLQFERCIYTKYSSTKKKIKKIKTLKILHKLNGPDRIILNSVSTKQTSLNVGRCMVDWFKDRNRKFGNIERSKYFSKSQFQECRHALIGLEQSWSRRGRRASRGGGANSNLNSQLPGPSVSLGPTRILCQKYFF